MWRKYFTIVCFESVKVLYLLSRSSRISRAVVNSNNDLISILLYIHSYLPELT